MLVYNLTDVPTSALTQRGLVNCQLVVGTRMSNPGEYVEVEDTPLMRARLVSMVELGALSLDTLPPSYVSQRSQAAQAAGKVPVRHLVVQETRTTAAIHTAAQVAVGHNAPSMVLRRQVPDADPAEPVVAVTSVEDGTPATDSGKLKKKGHR